MLYTNGGDLKNIQVEAKKNKKRYKSFVINAMESFQVVCLWGINRSGSQVLLNSDNFNQQNVIVLCQN